MLIFHKSCLFVVAVQTSKCTLSNKATVINHIHSYDCLFFYLVAIDAHLVHLKQPSSFTILYSHTLLRLPIFYLVAIDAHLVHLKQPSSFTNLAFLLLLSKLPSAPFPLKQLLLITCTLVIAYFFFYF